MKTKEIFCANEQKLTEHILTVDNNGEIVATCECGRFIKLPTGINVKQAETLLELHAKVNELSEKQLEVEENRKISEEVIDAITNVTSKVTEEPA